MDELTERDFLVLTDANDNLSFVNLRLVRMVDEIRDGHCRLWFSDTHRVEINGAGAGFFIARFSERSIIPTGEPLDLRTITEAVSE